MIHDVNKALFHGKTVRKTAALMLAVLFVLGGPLACKKKTEREQYEELKGSFKYRTYRALSEKMIPRAVKTYNDQRLKDQQPLDEDVVRLLLAYGWAVTQRSAFAVAEGSLVMEKSRTPEMRFLGQAVLAVALYENGWKDLGYEEAQKSHALLNQSPSLKDTEMMVMTFHLLMASLSVYQDNPRAARFHFAGFSNITRIHWPYQVFDALVDIKQKDIRGGLVKLKKMTEDPTVPPEVQTVIREGIVKVEKDFGPVDSRLFWPRAVSAILFRQLKDAGSASVQKLGGLISELTEKMK